MITLVFAHAENGVIGSDGKLPWHLPADLKRFKALTLGKPMIMGRKTFESFPAPLPGRRHILLTRDADWSAAGAEVAHTVEAALALAGGDVSVIGGAEVFRLFEDRADCAEVTTIWREYEGDAQFTLDAGRWQELAREDHAAEGERPAYSFFTLTPRR
ncbi:dihydrofolate reductase [Sphingomonas populi]|uniref:Dihydrofolate reductase n=1 Tax=Sphingomonas populi TaxID=2484750 RepID=A0A4Q6Y484_9SPHN|nr:dihydrofolate reductase [Sphingomonas populi]RZF64209.1 dihydrofolate reductase [Sphingomonas populi]